MHAPLRAAVTSPAIVSTTARIQTSRQQVLVASLLVVPVCLASRALQYRLHTWYQNAALQSLTAQYKRLKTLICLRMPKSVPQALSTRLKLSEESSLSFSTIKLRESKKARKRPTTSSRSRKTSPATPSSVTRSRPSTTLMKRLQVPNHPELSTSILKSSIQVR